MENGIKLFLTRYVKVFLILTAICPPMTYLLNFIVNWMMSEIQPGAPFYSLAQSMSVILGIWEFLEICIVLGLIASFGHAILRAVRFRNNDSVNRWGP